MKSKYKPNHICIDRNRDAANEAKIGSQDKTRQVALFTKDKFSAVDTN